MWQVEKCICVPLDLEHEKWPCLGTLKREFKKTGCFNDRANVTSIGHTEYQEVERVISFSVQAWNEKSTQRNGSCSGRIYPLICNKHYDSNRHQLRA